MNTIIELWLGLWWMMFTWAAPWALAGLVCVVVALAWMGLQAAYRAAVWALARNRDLRHSDLRGSGGHGPVVGADHWQPLTFPASVHGLRSAAMASVAAGEETIIHNARVARFAAAMPELQAAWERDAKDLDRLHPSPTPAVDEITSTIPGWHPEDGTPRGQFPSGGLFAVGAAMAHNPATHDDLIRSGAAATDERIRTDPEYAALWAPGLKRLADIEAREANAERLRGGTGWRGTGGARNAETGPEAAWSRP